MPRITWESVARRDPRSGPLIMGHRGAPDDAPENTLTSFKLALGQGAEVLETDLRFTADGVIVLIHDPTVDRTTNGTGAVAAMTLAEIKRLRCRKPGETVYSEEPPPTLEELLDLTRGDVPLALELKDDRFLQAGSAQQLIDQLTKHGALDTTVLVSFSRARLMTFRPLAPGLRLGMITLSNPLPLYPTEFLGPFFPLLFLNPLYLWWARRLGKVVCPLDPSPEPRLGWYRVLRSPIVMTNHPRLTVAALRERYGPLATGDG